MKELTTRSEVYITHFYNLIGKHSSSQVEKEDILTPSKEEVDCGNGGAVPHVH